MELYTLPLETKGDQENLEPSHLPLASEENRQSGDECNIQNDDKLSSLTLKIL